MPPAGTKAKVFSSVYLDLQWKKKQKKRPNDEWGSGHTGRETPNQDLIPFQIIIMTVADRHEGHDPLMRGNVMPTGVTTAWLNMSNVWFAQDTSTVLNCTGIVPKINEFAHRGANVLIFFSVKRERETWPTVTSETLHFLWLEGERLKKGQKQTNKQKKSIREVKLVCKRKRHVLLVTSRLGGDEGISDEGINLQIFSSKSCP